MQVSHIAQMIYNLSVLSTLFLPHKEGHFLLRYTQQRLLLPFFSTGSPCTGSRLLTSEQAPRGQAMKADVALASLMLAATPSLTAAANGEDIALSPQTCLAPLTNEQACWCAGQMHSSIFLEQNCSAYGDHQRLVRPQVSGYLCSPSYPLQMAMIGLHAAHQRL